jgi:hypothetical protein
MRPRSLALVLALAVAGCADIRQESQVATPVGQSTVAGVGDVVLRVEGRESMPNVFGRADLFGRTRTTGFTTIQYGGMQGKNVVLLRSGVTTQSDATTMNSTGDLVNTPHGAVYIPPAGSTQTSVSQPAIPIVVDWKAQPAVPALGKTIIIENATPTALTYRVQ